MRNAVWAFNIAVRMLLYTCPSIRSMCTNSPAVSMMYSDMLPPLAAAQSRQTRAIFFAADLATSTPVREGPPPIGLSLKAIAEAAAADAEQQAIRRTLGDTKGNKSEAARLLRTDYKTLHVKMKQYGISSVPFKELRES